MFQSKIVESKTVKYFRLLKRRRASGILVKRNSDSSSVSRVEADPSKAVSSMVVTGLLNNDNAVKFCGKLPAAILDISFVCGRPFKKKHK